MNLNLLNKSTKSGSSRPEVFCKRVILKNFTKFTTVLESPLLKKETLAEVFSFEFWEIFKNPYFAQYLQTGAS